MKEKIMLGGMMMSKTEGIPKNPTMEDLAICPHCENELFYITDGNRHFCSKCRVELRNNSNFQGGKLLD